VKADGGQVTPAVPGEVISYIGADVSDNGRRIVFSATADQLFPSGENNYSGIFLRDLDAGTLTLISVGATPEQEPNESCENPGLTHEKNKKRLKFFQF
jgi:hypothetical protein